ncbi:hypothetical protein ACFOJE_21225 [Azotobacter bryophylli]|uniref:Uncharacterized protein n=1 Tax=Azotobacter bryophylli TaxID=1986537 RepID=A0ABV7B0D9_9GAMM
MITTESLRQLKRIELMSKADFEMAWALADFPDSFGYQDTMNGHQTKSLVARMLILGTAVKEICQRCSLQERQRKRLLEYAIDVYSQLFPRVGLMFIYDFEVESERQIRLSPAQ